MNLLVMPKITAYMPFKASKDKKEVQSIHEKNNPISRTGETINLAKATFIAGLGLGGKLLCEVFDGDFVVDIASKNASKMVDKNKPNVSSLKKDLCKIGGTFGLIMAGLAGFAVLYTVFKSPNIAYESKVNTFKKSNDMDVFIKQKDAQKGIYEQLNKEAQNATAEEKEKLKKQYMIMQNSQNK